MGPQLLEAFSGVFDLFGCLQMISGVDGVLYLMRMIMIIVKIMMIIIIIENLIDERLCWLLASLGKPQRQSLMI